MKTIVSKEYNTKIAILSYIALMNLDNPHINTNVHVLFVISLIFNFNYFRLTISIYKKMNF